MSQYQNRAMAYLLLRQFVGFFVVFAVLVALALTAFHYHGFSIERQRLDLDQRNAVSTARDHLTGDFSAIVSDLESWADRADLVELAVEGASDPQLSERLRHDLALFIRSKALYGRVTYVGAAGNWLLAVDFDEGDPRIRFENEDADRHGHLKHVLELPAGGIFISELALDAVNQRASIDFATAVTAEQGEPLGVITLSYLGNRLIERMQAALRYTSGTPFLVNSQGGWLREFDPALAIADEKFQDTHPEVWQRMAEEDTGQIRTRAGLFTYTTLYPRNSLAAHLREEPDNRAHGPAELAADEHRWRIVSFIDTETLATINWQRIERALIVYLILLLAGIALSFYVARIRALKIIATQSRQRLASIIEQTNDIVAITDPDGRFQYVNPAFERTTGYGREEVLGKNSNILQSDAHEAAFYQEVWNTLLNKEAFHGVFINRKKDGSLYYEQKTITPLIFNNRLSACIGTGKNITEAIQSDARLQHLASHHPLTGLPNRALFHSELLSAAARAQQDNKRMAVITLDLDDFKKINDSLGVKIGDEVLQEIAARVRANTPEADVVAHMGADEFAILLNDAGNAAQIKTFVGRLQQALQAPLAADGRELHVGSSIGISVYPDDTTDINKLTTSAITAMHHAKSLGRGGCQFYSAKLSERAHARLQLEIELRQALRRKEFVIHYQPITDGGGRRVTGMEALLRWRHPSRGLIPPAAFIDALEESGLIVPVTRWLLNEACRQSEKLRATGLPQLTVAVNISANSLVHDDLVATSRAALERVGMAPKNLTLEVTEGVLVADSHYAASVLERLRAMGIRIAIDDFGTGYSSLSYLKRFPADILKIDQGFVRGLADESQDRHLVSAILAMAHNLKMRVVAEGVETESQALFLRRRHCDCLQGFLYSQPLPPEQLDRYLAREEPFPWIAASEAESSGAPTARSGRH